MEAVSRLAHRELAPDFVAKVREGYRSGGEQGLWEATLEWMQSAHNVRGRDYDMLQAFTQLGRTDEAFALVDQLLCERSPLVAQISRDPLLDPLRSDPRYEKVLERLGLR